MRVTIDLEKDIIIIPDNFFVKIAEENEKLKKYGVTPISGIDRIKNSFNKAIAETDNRLLTQSNAKTKRKLRIPSLDKVEKNEGLDNHKETKAESK